MVPSIDSIYDRHNGGTDPFIDPYVQYSNRTAPTGFSGAMKWAERAALHDGLYFSALWRIVSYFITDIEIEGEDLSQEEKDDYKEFFIDGLEILPRLAQIGVDYLVYGNSFPTFVVPFTRHLLCLNCRNYEAPLRELAANPNRSFGWSRFKFHARCPRCQVRGEFKKVDRPSDRREDLRIVIRSPHEIDLVHDPYTHHTRYFWKLPEYYREALTNRPRRHEEVLPTFQLERAPWSVIEAVRDQRHVLFDQAFIYHVKDTSLSGVLNYGWGIPRGLTTRGQTFYVQSLRRMNETLAIDYAVPIRLISPEAGANAGPQGDPMLSSNLGGMNAALAGIVDRHRRDGAGWHFFPFAVKYQLLGGEASQLAPAQLIELAQNDALGSIGVPVEFYRGSLSMQNTLTASRLFESYHANLLHHLNGVLNWAASRICESQGWDRFKVYLPRPSHFDDINRQLAKIQIAGQGMMSQTDALASIGVNWRDQQRKILHEQEFIAELTTKVEERMQGRALGDQMAGAVPPPGGQPAPGAPAAGGAPADPAAAMPVDPRAEIMAMLPTSELEQMTPADIEARASAVADRLFTMDETTKDSTLIWLKKVAPTIHARIKELLDEKRQAAARNGQALIQRMARNGNQPQAA